MSTQGPFDLHARRYDQWYDRLPGARIFQAEVACLRALLNDTPAPMVEIGVGTGRFSAALNLPWGVDPSRPMLRLARPRVPYLLQARGEALPFREGTFGTALLVVTLCFVLDPLTVLREIHRILRSGGWVVGGWIPRESPWATVYARKGAQGHPLYRVARFHARREVEEWLKTAGFQPPRYRSTLRVPPETAPPTLRSVPGVPAGAGFVCFAARRG